MAKLALTGVRKSFGKTEILKGIDLTIPDGAFVVFVGPSGCGKSTLLRVIAGLESATAGRIEIDGSDVTQLRAAERGLAMVFQSYALYPHMSVRQNIAFALENMALPRAEIEARVARAAEMLRLGEYLDRKPAALSGGQRQRVAIGRAVVRDPRIFLFDEPLSNLDAELRVATRKELAALHGELGGTMIYVTHDQVEAMTLADRIVVLNAGRIEQEGAPLDLYHRPANRFVAGFLGSPPMNFLPCRAVEGGVEIAGGARFATPFAASAVEIGARPEHVTLAVPGEGHFDAAVELVERLGADSFIYLRDDAGHALAARAPEHVTVKRGDRAGVTLPADRLSFFDAQGAALRQDQA